MGQSEHARICRSEPLAPALMTCSVIRPLVLARDVKWRFARERPTQTLVRLRWYADQRRPAIYIKCSLYLWWLVCILYLILFFIILSFRLVIFLFSVSFF